MLRDAYGVIQNVDHFVGRIYPMNRRRFLTQCALGSAGLAALVQGCQPNAQTGSALAADPVGQAAPGERPAIDQAPPTVYETATFALG
jgi:hypothetical protein